MKLSFRVVELGSWPTGELAFVRDDSNILRDVTEVVAARLRIYDPKFYVGLAKFHSTFGGVVSGVFRNSSLRSGDMRQPVSSGVIKAAAAKAGIDAGKIDAAVESLSEFLRWDITKGQPLD